MLNSKELMQFQTVFRRATCFLAGLLLIWFSVLFPFLAMSSRAIASPNDSIASQVYSQDNLTALVPDWSQLTFAALPPIRQNVDVTASGQISDADRYGLVRRIGAGMTPDQYLKLGDFEDSLYPQYMSLQSIASVSQAQYNLSQVALSGFDLIQNQTLNDLKQAIPGLGDFSAIQIPPIAALLKQAKLGDWTDKSLNQLLQWKPDLGNLKLGTIKLDPFSVTDLPGL